MRKEEKDFWESAKEKEVKINLKEQNKKTEGTKTAEKTSFSLKDRRFLNLADWFIRVPLYLVVVLVPLVFLQNVPSALELNKQVLFVALVGVSVLAWIGKMAWKNEIKFKKSFLLIPVLTFLLIYGLSTVFSDYYEQSMWGYFGGESRAFVSVLFFVAFFILIYNNIRSFQGISKFLFSFLISGLFLVIFGILQFFEIYLLPFDFAQSKFFNPIGSIYVFAIYLGLVFLISITLFLSGVPRWLKGLLLGLAVASFFLLMVINFKMLWIILLVILAFILGMTILIENQKTTQARVIPMIFLVLTLLFLLRSKPLLDNSNIPMEIFLKQKVAAKISLDAIKADPMLGSGPTMFSNVYKQNRPNNLGTFSTINFNESTSFFYTLASTTGILGTLSFLFLVGSGFVLLFKEITGAISRTEQRENMHRYWSLSVGVAWLFLTIFLFIYFVSISVLMLWWMFYALLVSSAFLNNKDKEKAVAEISTASSSPKTSFFLSFGFVLIIIGFIAVIYLQGQKYLAAVYFQGALKAGNQQQDIDVTSEKVSKAVSLDPNRDSYYRDLAVVHLALAKEKIDEKGIQNLTPDESNFISTRFRNALQSLNQAKLLNPKNSLNFVSAGKLYEEFIIIDRESGDKAIENYEEAIRLDPQNPDLYLAVAGVKILLSDLNMIEQNAKNVTGQKLEPTKESLEDLAMAEDYLLKALEVNDNYVKADLALVSVYEKQGDLNKAVEKASSNVDKYPKSSEFAMELGRLYYQQENFDKAEESLRTSLDLNYQYANARYLLGLVLDKKGNRGEALAEFKKVQETNSDNELLKTIIDNLENGKSALSGINESEAENQEIQTEPIETQPEEAIIEPFDPVEPEVTEEPAQ